MHPVACGRCGISVLVSKFSPEQTSIQWEVDSSTCALRDGLPLGETCPALSDSIRAAVLTGALGVDARDE